MNLTGFIVLILSSIISASENKYQSGRSKMLVDTYLYLDPGDIKALFEYELTLTYTQIIGYDDPSIMQFCFTIENVDAALKNLQSGYISNNDNCKELNDLVNALKTPFLLNCKNGVFKNIVVDKNDPDNIIDIKLRLVFLFQASIKNLFHNSVTTTKEYDGGTCEAEYEDLTIIPNISGSIFELYKKVDMHSCTKFYNNNLTLDDSCNSMSNNERQWNIDSYLGGKLHTPSTYMTNINYIDRLSFKPWKDSSEVLNVKIFASMLQMEKFNKTVNVNFNEENSKVIETVSERESPNKNIMQSKQLGMAKLYRGLQCNNMNNMNIYDSALEMLIICEAKS